MSETERIANILEQTFEGKAYYGRSVLENLEGVTAKMAMRKPENSQNSIWALVVHMTLELIYHRKIIEGGAEKWVAGQTTWEKDFDRSAASWEQTIDELKAANRALVSAIRTLDDDILEKEAAPLSYSYYRMLNGILQHGIYHSGQISILKTQFQ